VRLNLAQALMCRSDLLLLDEPTNHLDLDAVIWLEKWLRAYRGTLLLISHDRDFLDAVVDHIAFTSRAPKLTLYTGNYSDFERSTRRNSSPAAGDVRSSSARSPTCKSYIDRFRAKATKARQAQSRIKALARMEEVTAAHVDTPFDLPLPSRIGSARSAAHAQGSAAGYGDKPCCRD
jgi:ATP-binding cassette subfamily F protein 3